MGVVVVRDGCARFVRELGGHDVLKRPGGGVLHLRWLVGWPVGKLVPGTVRSVRTGTTGEATRPAAGAEGIRQHAFELLRAGRIVNARDGQHHTRRIHEARVGQAPHSHTFR